MKVSNSKGIANHAGPESCAGGSNSTGEAWTGEKAGWVLSLEKGNVPCADSVRGEAGNITSAITQAKGGHGVVGDPMQAWKHFKRESGEPLFAQRKDGTLGRSGKSEDTSQ